MFAQCSQRRAGIVVHAVLIIERVHAIDTDQKYVAGALAAVVVCRDLGTDAECEGCEQRCTRFLRLMGRLLV